MKIIKIYFCKGCPYSKTVGNQYKTTTCKKAKRVVQDIDILVMTTPKWCPLEDGE